MANPLNRGQRVRGALVGVAVGDALGWPQEQNAKNVDRRIPAPAPKFRSWTRRAGGRFQPYEEHINAGEFSDDTQLTLCIARSLLHGDAWLEHFTRNELPTWALYERGGGRSVLRAASSWSTGRPPWTSDKADPREYFATGANGVAMRVLPHVAFGLGSDFDTVRQRIALDAVATHGHAAALIGALMHASSLWHALQLEGTLGYGELLERLSENISTWADLATLDLPSDWLGVRQQVRGDSYEYEWSRAVDTARGLLDIASASMRSGPLADDEDTLKRLGVFDRKVNGSGIVTAIGAALMASRAASSPELGLVQSAFLKRADTDTLASMTAGLLGAISGLDWMDGLQRTVQDYDYLVGVADRLVLGETETAAVTTPVAKSGLDRWARSLSGMAPGTVTELPNGRAVLVEAVEDIPTKSAGSTTARYKLRAGDGETLYIVKHSRSSKKDTAVSNEITRVGVRVRVSSLGESRRFYEEILGLSASRTGDAFARYGDAFALEVAPHGKQKLHLADSDFIIHLEAQDVETLHAAVRSSGARIVEPLREEKGRSRFTCSDPDGHLVEVVAPQRLP